LVNFAKGAFVYLYLLTGCFWHIVDYMLKI